MKNSDTLLRGDSDNVLWLEDNNVSLRVSNVSESVYMFEILPEAMVPWYPIGQDNLIERGKLSGFLTLRPLLTQGFNVRNKKLAHVAQLQQEIGHSNRTVFTNLIKF